jgi:hypothetical protein
MTRDRIIPTSTRTLRVPAAVVYKKREAAIWKIFNFNNDLKIPPPNAEKIAKQNRNHPPLPLSLHHSSILRTILPLSFREFLSSLYRAPLPSLSQEILYYPYPPTLLKAHCAQEATSCILQHHDDEADKLVSRQKQNN